LADVARKQVIHSHLLNDNKKTKVLWYSDSPYCATGFGTVARNILKTLDYTGDYEGICVGINDWGQARDEIFSNFKVDAGMKVGTEIDTNVYKFKFLVNTLATKDFDILFTLQDTFIFQSEGLLDAIVELKRRKGFQWIMYFPIDGEPFPQWLKGLEHVDHLITYTKYGKREVEIKRPDLKGKVSYIYHGTDTSTFYPIQDKAEKEAWRKQFLGSENAGKKIITNINRNQPRKDIVSTLKAFKILREKNENVALYLHMKMSDMGGDLGTFAHALGLVGGRDVIFPQNFDENVGYPPEILNNIYNMSDVLLTTTTGEGWGLTVTEAFSARVPVVAPCHTSLAEIMNATKGIDTPLEDLRGFPVRAGHDLEHKNFLTGDLPVLRDFVDIRDTAKTLGFVLDEKNKEVVEGVIDRAFDWVYENTWDDINTQWLKVFATASRNATITKMKAVKDRQRESIVDKTGGAKIGRNDPCPCGSGNKYKKCCGG